MPLHPSQLGAHMLLLRQHQDAALLWFEPCSASTDINVRICGFVVLHAQRSAVPPQARSKRAIWACLSAASCCLAWADARNSAAAHRSMSFASAVRRSAASVHRCRISAVQAASASCTGVTCQGLHHPAFRLYQHATDVPKLLTLCLSETNANALRQTVSIPLQSAQWAAALRNRPLMAAAGCVLRLGPLQRLGRRFGPEPRGRFRTVAAARRWPHQQASGHDLRTLTPY